MTASIIDPTTRDALNRIGCLKEGGLDTKAMAAALAAQLEQHHIAQDLTDVPAVETTVGQLVSAVVGRPDEQVIDLVKPLVSAGPKSFVQQALSNGYMLCSGRARIEVTIEGERKITTVGTRFLSADHDVLDRYVLEARRRRGESFFASTKELTELVTTRQPGMGERVGTFLERLNVSYRKALGDGGGS